MTFSVGIEFIVTGLCVPKTGSQFLYPGARAAACFAIFFHTFLLIFIIFTFIFVFVFVFFVGKFTKVIDLFIF